MFYRCFSLFSAFKYFIKRWFLHQHLLWIIWHIRNNLVLTFENFNCFDFNSNLNLVRFRANTRLSTIIEVTWHHYQRVTVAWLPGRHNSPPLQEISSRDLRGGVRGRNWLQNSNGSSRSWLLFSKRSIHYIDVFISLLQVIMMKSSFSSGTPTYLRIGKGQLGYDRMLMRETIWG